MKTHIRTLLVSGVAWLLMSGVTSAAVAPGLVVSLLERAAAVGRVPDALLERLAGLHNADQAYLILSEAGTPARLTLVGNTPVGMLYAARLQRLRNATDVHAEGGRS